MVMPSEMRMAHMRAVEDVNYAWALLARALPALPEHAEELLEARKMLTTILEKLGKGNLNDQ